MTQSKIHPLTERQKLGLYSLADVQRMVGYSTNQVWKLANTKKIPSPTHVFGRKLYYALDDLDAVLKAIKDSLRESPPT